MKNLMTRKIGFGLLIACVLALGVQGVADALTFGTTRTNDLQRIVSGGTFSVGLAVTAVSEERKPAYTDYIVDPNDSTRYFLDSTSGDNDNDQYDSGESTISTANAFYYNNEAVRISVSGAGAKITRIGTNTITPATSITLKEGGTGAEELVAAITVNCSTTTHGEVTITASDATPSEDYPSGVRKAPNFILTTYVVQFNRNVGVTRTIRLVGVTNGVAIGYDDQSDQPIYNGDSSHYPVTYTVTGGGMVKIQEGTGTNSREGTSAASLTTSTAAKVLLEMESGTNTVTATLGGSLENSQGIYIFGNPQLNITGGNGQSGTPNTALTTALAVTLTDTASTAEGVAGVPIKFDVTDTSPSGGILNQVTGTTIVDASNEVISSPIPGSTMYVRTDSSGVASISFQLGTIPGKQTVTASALNIARLTKTINATATGTPGTRQLYEEAIQRQGSTNIYTLVARVENGGQPDPEETVTFTTTKGLLTGRNADNSAALEAKTVYAVTNNAGIARVTYNAMDSSGNLEVVASISVVSGSTVTQLQEVTFNVRGGSSGQQNQNQNQNQQQEFDAPPDELVEDSGDNQRGEPGATLSDPFVVQLLDTDGDPLDDIEVTFTVLSGGGTLSDSTDTTDSSGRAETTLTLGSSSGTNTVRASVDFSGVSSVTFTATAEEPAPVANRLRIEGGNDQTGELNRVLSEDLTVQLLDADGDGIQSITIDFEVTAGDGIIARRNNGRTDENGYASARFSPRSTGNIEVEASVRGIGTISSVIFRISGGSPPDALIYVSGNNQSGRPGARLANPLIVQVEDENDDPVSGITVTFTATAGGGSVSPRSATTDNNGRAQTRLTLGDDIGENTVQARVSGLTDRVTFRATSGAEVLVDAASRPDMYWISRTEGKLQRLVDDDVEAIAPNISGITSLAIDTQNDLLYWTRQTGENRSTIQRAGLNGRGVVTLQTSLTLMNSIAVNDTGTTFYWTDILGKIKSKPTQGNTVTLLRQNLSAPRGLVWANDYLYWGEATGHIRRMNLRNTRRQVETITTSAGEPISLAVHNGRVYWTETSGNASKLKRVNTDGTDLRELKTLTGTRRVWLTVDGSDAKIYLTRLSKIERRNLAGQNTVNIVASIESPGSLVLGGNLVRTTPVVSQPSQPTQPTNNAAISKYDINEDGAVNNADTRLVAADVGNSGNAIKTARADVDGSGTVDVTDLILVIANLDDTVAAPAIDIDVKSLDINFDLVQEQIETLLASGDRSIAAQRALLYLQHLLANARPDETVLLANYPNPFNPETWIPYHLAESTDVKIRIYDAQGVLVRALTLGHQSAGYYTSQSRAAYWDGRNALGERVASGIYFYQLETDEMSPLRKMVILK